MLAHDLAELLIAGPNVPVFVTDSGYGREELVAYEVVDEDNIPTVELR